MLDEILSALTHLRILTTQLIKTSHLDFFRGVKLASRLGPNRKASSKNPRICLQPCSLAPNHDDHCRVCLVIETTEGAWPWTTEKRTKTKATKTSHQTHLTESKTYGIKDSLGNGNDFCMSNHAFAMVVVVGCTRACEDALSGSTRKTNRIWWIWARPRPFQWCTVVRDLKHLNIRWSALRFALFRNDL